MRSRTILWFGALAVVCFAFTTLLRTVDRTIFRSGGTISSSAAAPAQLPTHSSVPTLPTFKPPATSPNDQHWEAMKLLTEARVAQQATLGSIEQWDEEMTPLLNGEDGQTIAVNKDLVEKLAYVLRQQDKDEAEISSIGEQITLLEKRVEQLTVSPPKLLSAREMYEIRRIHGSSVAAKRSWTQAIKQANAIMLRAHLDANPDSTPTLQQSLEQIDSDMTLQQLDEKMTKAEDAGVESEPMDVIDEEFDAIDRKRRKEAMSAEVKSTLAPFLEPRSIQPSLAGRFSIKFSRTGQKRPMSLGKLMSIGALGETELSLKKLALIGGNRKLPEPKWSISSQPHGWSEDDEEFLRKAQQMLRDYGAVLVDEGLLSQ